jgi:arylamine N-acetyltransferase
LTPVDDILDALDLSRAQPGSGFLEALFARFNAKVPFENASKIVRDREQLDLGAKIRTPGIFWAEHLELGTGGTCFARVAAFDALLSELGFRTRRLTGRVRHDDDHAALVVETSAGEQIVDVGFPLPAILPARAGTVATAQGELSVEETSRGFRIEFREGVPEAPQELEVFTAPVSQERYEALWRDTFRPDALFLRQIQLRRDLGNRVLSYAEGELRVDDLHSRLRVPLPPPRAAALSAHFGVDAAILERALAAVGEATGERPDATLTAYLETEAEPAKAFATIATREGYRKLLEGVAQVGAGEDTAGGYRLTLSAPSGGGGGEAATITEDVATDQASHRISITRLQGESRFASSYRAIARSGKRYLVREARLSGQREDLLRNDSLRGRLAGTLAVDLLAWARMLSKEP